MEYTEEEKRQFQKEFARRQRNYARFFWVMAIFGLLLAFALQISNGELLGFSTRDWITIFFITLFIPAFAFQFINLRCPACNGYLWRDPYPKFCPMYGTQLHDP